MNLTEVTFPQLVAVAAVILAIIGAYNAIMTAIKNYRDEKTMKSRPIEEMKARLDAHDKMLARDRERLDAMQEQSVIMLRGVKAILSHEVNGNSVDKMKQSMAEIDDYLIRRR